MEEVTIAFLRPPRGDCHVGSTDRERLMPLERSYKDVPERGTCTVLDQAAASDELARLSLAHEQLLRYARDLKCAYEAERERRAHLAEALSTFTRLGATYHRQLAAHSSSTSGSTVVADPGDQSR
jgi:hypothetical protein